MTLRIADLKDEAIRILPALIAAAIVSPWAGSAQAAMKDTPHPYILWTPAEAAASGICGCLFWLGILTSKGQLVSASLED